MIDTRNKNQNTDEYTAVLSGAAPSHGLWVPDCFPSVRISDTRVSSDLFMEIGPEIMALFFPKVRVETWRELFEMVYPPRFEHRCIAPVSFLKNHPSTVMLELFHGPTLAFKDIALSLLPHIMSLALARGSFASADTATKIEGHSFEENVLILTATSGDTGKAALSAFANVPRIGHGIGHGIGHRTRIIVLFPENGVSSIQKKMMLAEKASNTRVYPIRGSFDDAQKMVKTLMADDLWRDCLRKEGFFLSTANSINIARILVQTIYYFSAYEALVDCKSIHRGDAINFCVPTGNFGNILAGYYAFKMGLPVHRLICASNPNHILTDFFRTGVYDLNAYPILKKTHSPSMDILMASNFERWLFEALDRNDILTEKAMRALSQHKRLCLDTNALKDFELFWAGYCSDTQTVDTIHETFVESGTLIDPHTAVALAVLKQYREKTADPTLCVVHATASPYKFPQTIAKALSLPFTSEEDSFGPDSADIEAEATDTYAKDLVILKRLSELSKTPLPRAITDLSNIPIEDTKVFEIEEAKEHIQNISLKGWQV